MNTINKAVCMLIALCALVWSMPDPARASVNVLRNSDFSAGGSSWNVNTAITSGWSPIAEGKANLHPPTYAYTGQVIYQNLNVGGVNGATFNFSCNLSKTSASSGHTIAFYIEYADTGNVRHHVQIANPDNDSITDATLVTGTVTLPADARKLVKFYISKLDYGEFSVDNISLATDSTVINGAVPLVSGLSAVSGPYGVNLTITGSDFGAGSGIVRLNGSSAGLSIQSWSATSISITVQTPARSGLVGIETDLVESDGNAPFRITSPYFTLDVVKPEQSFVKGEVAEFVVSARFLNGFTSSAMDFEVKGSGGSASPFAANSVLITPMPLKNSGGFSVRINTSDLTAGNYQGEITAKAPYTFSVPFKLTVITVADIKFYENVCLEIPPYSCTKQYLTTKTINTQGAVSGIMAEALDSNGDTLNTPIILSSSDPSRLGAYKLYFWGYSLYALNNGAVNLVATTADGTSRSLPITIAVPDVPKVTNISVFPMTITNKQTGSDNPIYVSATLAPPEGSFGYGWGLEGSLSMLATYLDQYYDTNTNSFGYSFYINQDTYDLAAPQPPDPGVIGVNVSISDTNYSTTAKQELPLTIINDPTYSAAKAAVRSLDPNAGMMQPMLMLDFCDAEGTKLFGKMSYGEAMFPNELTTLGGIAPGQYKIKYSGFSGDPVWYPNATSAADAQLVSFVAGGESSVMFYPPLTSTLTATLAGTGSGAVTASPAAMTCSASSCTGTYTTGAWVTLHPVPSAGSIFTGWSGACGGTGDCTVAATSETTVTATFTIDKKTVYVTINGSGEGNVNSDPTGLTCGSGTCDAQFNALSTVKLMPTSNSGSVFAGWSGGVCSGTGNCEFTLDADKSATATFNVIPNVLLIGSTTTTHGTLKSAFDAALDGNTIKARNVTLSEILTFGNIAAIKLGGGYGSDFNIISGITRIKGSLRINRGTIRPSAIAIF